MKKIFAVSIVVVLFLCSVIHVIAEELETDNLTMIFEMPALYDLRKVFSDHNDADILSISVFTFPAGYSGTYTYLNQGKMFSGVITEDTAFIRIVAQTVNKFGVASEIDFCSWIKSYDKMSKLTDEEWADILSIAISAINSGGYNKDAWPYAMFYAVMDGGAPFTETTLDLDYLLYRYNNGGNIWQRRVGRLYAHFMPLNSLEVILFPCSKRLRIEFSTS